MRGDHNTNTLTENQTAQSPIEANYKFNHTSLPPPPTPPPPIPAGKQQRYKIAAPHLDIHTRILTGSF